MSEDSKPPERVARHREMKAAAVPDLMLPNSGHPPLPGSGDGAALNAFDPPTVDFRCPALHFDPKTGKPWERWENGVLVTDDPDAKCTYLPSRLHENDLPGATKIDIHGVDWSKIPQVSDTVFSTLALANGIMVWINGPVTKEQLESFREHIRSWHP